MLGFSFEATELANPAWGSGDSDIEPMLAALDSPILRFGGQLVDRRTLWTSTGERAATMAVHARDAFGESLLAISIGNEPNGYHYPDDPERSIRGEDSSTDAYQESLQTYADAIDEAAPGIAISGPGAFDAAWWRAFTEAELPTTHALSMHWYPLCSCGPSRPDANPTIENLTSPDMRERAESFVGRGAEMGVERRRAFAG